MATDTDQLHFLARNGHFGPNAMHDPNTFVQNTAPQLGLGPPDGTLIAQNDPNDKLKINIQREAAPKTDYNDQETGQDARNQKINDALAQRIKMSGVTDADLDRMKAESDAYEATLK